MILESGIGAVRLGMTLDEARRALAHARFARVSDGDGAALVEVVMAQGESLILWAGEDEPNAAIDWSRTIKSIETFSRVFHTAEGIRPGSLVSEAETVFGRTKQIDQSEIESRQYIVFERQPEYLMFRLDYTGIFPGGVRTTTELQPRARILSILVSRPEPARAVPAGVPELERCLSPHRSSPIQSSESLTRAQRGYLEAAVARTRLGIGIRDERAAG